jgi:phenol 2-monooxygenase
MSAAMLSAPLKDAEQPENGGVTPEEIQAYFVKQGRYTAGTATRYTPSLFTGEATHQDLAIGFPLASVCTPRRWCACATPAPCIWGTRFCRWPLARFCLWRAAARLTAIPPSGPCATSIAILPRRFSALPSGADRDSVIDVMAIFQQSHHDVPLELTHPFLQPARGHLRCKIGKDVLPRFRGAAISMTCVIDRERLHRHRAP